MTCIHPDLEMTAGGARCLVCGAEDSLEALTATDFPGVPDPAQDAQLRDDLHLALERIADLGTRDDWPQTAAEAIGIARAALEKDALAHLRAGLRKGPGTPRPGIDRLACPGCGMSWAYCQQGMGKAYGSPDVCCLSCRHQVRPCIGSDAG